MKCRKKIFTAFTALLMFISCFAVIDNTFTTPFTAEAASADYPTQIIRISLSDNSKNLNISGVTDNSPCNVWGTNGEQNENWRLDYVGTDSNGSFYKITNMGTGRLLTPKGYKAEIGTECVIYGSESHTSQHWYIIPVDKDKYGDDLHYKLVNYDNRSMAVTYDENGIKLTEYNDSDSQKWLLNTAGIQGFGGYCKDMNGNVKASVTGGLLGETVEVTTFDELKKACTDDTVKTILVTKNISGKTTGYEKTLSYDNNYRYICRDDYIYLHPNKTIIGSYGANTLHNVFFRTYDHANYGLGNNVIIRNINVTHDKELNYDNIWEFSYGHNFWLDHITFNGHEKINGASLGSPDFDKFINFKGGTNFITISDCKIGLGEYGVLLGYPTDTEEIYQQYNGLPCVTLCDNSYKDTLTRAPGLMRYGYFHSMNNYVLNFDMGYTIYTAAKLYAEGCYYDAGTGKGSVVNDTVSANDISSKYPGFYTEVNSSLVNSKYTLTAKTAKPCTWNPSSNYNYKAKSAAEAKDYCSKHTGAQTSKDAMTYASFAKQGVPSAGYVVKPDKPITEPTTEPVKPTEPHIIKGDADKNGKFDISDIEIVQKWLVRYDYVIDWRACDMNADGIINVFDLMLMKRLLIKGEPAPVETTAPVTTEPSVTTTTDIKPHTYEPTNFVPSGNVYLVGDSTVCDYDDNTAKSYNRYGCGMKLAEQYNGITVKNLALSGRSSRSFLEEKNYQTLCNSIGKGDYLFIQFGHNDEKTDESKYPGLGTYPGLDMNTLDSNGKNSSGQYSYEWIILNKYIKTAQSKGAVPVIVTPITRRGSDGTANYSGHTKYQQALIELGKKNNIAVIDMTELTRQLYTNLYNYGGADETAKMHCYADTAHTQLDNTHLSNAGVFKIAQMIAEQTKAIGLSIGNKIK